MEGLLVTAALAVLAVLGMVLYAHWAARRMRGSKEGMRRIQMRSDGGLWSPSDPWPFRRRKRK